jgi:predicted short-subunit dehydrogenase-like oxidoreductase (DUF2520 family)
MTHYAILGGGRLARHMRHYFSLLQQPCSGWARDSRSPLNSHTECNAEERLRSTIAPATHVLLLVSDHAIGPLVDRYPFLREKILIHCSGATSLAGIAGAHPLMSFAGELYSLAQYRSIPFTVENGYRFRDLFPSLPNPHHPIDPADKAKYHALCVMAGNFPQIMWQAVATRLTQMGLPADSQSRYLEQVLHNFTSASSAALTGPLTRGDDHTVRLNLAALENDRLQGLYQAFCDFYPAHESTTVLQEATA